MGKNILVIDDDRIVVKSLQKLLEKAGYSVVITQSGEDALEKIKDHNFHLIVCDIRMPQMDGIETIKAIRKYLAEQGKKGIPEIIITGYADKERYESAVGLKVADYLYKPFDTTEFLEVIQRNLESAK